MKKFKISTVAAIAVYAMLAVVLSSCSQNTSNREDPKQFVYVGKGMIVFSKELSKEPKWGKYVYKVKDESGTIIIWSNENFDIGDTLCVSKI